MKPETSHDLAIHALDTMLFDVRRARRTFAEVYPQTGIAQKPYELVIGELMQLEKVAEMMQQVLKGHYS